MLKRIVPLIAILAFLLALGIGSLLAQDTTKPMAKDTTQAAAKDTTKKDEGPKHEYVGAKKCKICHKTEYDSWLTTKHAQAWGALTAKEQKTDCATCHSTGTTAKGELLEGVQCEACHGPGNDYRKTKIMKDIKLAMENGLIMPTAETCEKCHNKKSPTFKGFDFEKMVVNPAGIHAHPTKE
jgi:RecJ-like exonuclease